MLRGDVYLRGIHHVPGLETYGENVPADVPDLRDGGLAGAGGPQRGSMAFGEPGRDFKLPGPDAAPRGTLHGADFYRRILIRGVASRQGHVPVGLYGKADQYQRSDPP